MDKNVDSIMKNQYASMSQDAEVGATGDKLLELYKGPSLNRKSIYGRNWYIFVEILNCI